MWKKLLTKTAILAVICLTIALLGAVEVVRAQQIGTIPYWVGTDYAVAVDQMGNTHISYYDHTMKNLRYAVYNGARWQIDLVDTTPYAGQHSSIVLDWAGAPHILYYDQANKLLKYARATGAQWRITTLDTQVTLTAYTYTSVALDSRGNPQICYYDQRSYGLKHIWFDGWNWHTSVQRFSSGW